MEWGTLFQVQFFKFLKIRLQFLFWFQKSDTGADQKNYSCPNSFESHRYGTFYSSPGLLKFDWAE
jgi:hypothetical protein